MFRILKDWGASGNPGHSLVGNTKHPLVSFAVGSLVVIKHMTDLTNIQVFN